MLHATHRRQILCRHNARVVLQHGSNRRQSQPLIYDNPETLREVVLTLPTLPLVLRTPLGSFPRRLSPLRFGLPRTLLRVADPLPDFMLPGVLGRDPAPIFSTSLLLSLSMEV